MLDLRVLGSKLEKYRAQLTETIDEVAEATGIDPKRISSLESGQIEPTGDEILIFADHYKCDFRYFISNERIATFEQTETLYRAYGNDFTKEDRRRVQEFLFLCEVEAFLMSELDLSSKTFSYTPKGNFFKAHGEKGAEELRNFLGFNPIELPRDVYAEFRKVGVHIFRRKLGNSNISGLFIRHPTAGPCALVNLSEDIYRQRFSAAHEMGHAVFDAENEVSVTYFQTNSKDLREVRANRFASCFLMPPSFLNKLPSPSAWTDEDTTHWANEMRVSCQALGIALMDAGLVDNYKASQIQSLRIKSEDKIDPELPPTLSPNQLERKNRLLEKGLSNFYVKLCFESFHRGVISIGRLTEVLLCTQAELTEFTSLYGQSL